MRTIFEQTVGRICREFQKCGFSSYLREIIAKLRKATEIPTGYQDKTGFHFGVEPYASDGPRLVSGVRLRNYGDMDSSKTGSGRKAMVDRSPHAASRHSHLNPDGTRNTEFDMHSNLCPNPGDAGENPEHRWTEKCPNPLPAGAAGDLRCLPWVRAVVFSQVGKE
jgi:hypothetical protein